MSMDVKVYWRQGLLVSRVEINPSSIAAVGATGLHNLGWWKFTTALTALGAPACSEMHTTRMKSANG